MKALLVASSIAFCACAAETPISTTTTTSAEVRVVPAAPAIERVSHAQCARAQACGAIEQRGIYRSADYCEENLERAIRDDMTGCARVDSWRLDACFEAIRIQSCQRAAENEYPPDECRQAALCR